MIRPKLTATDYKKMKYRKRCNSECAYRQHLKTLVADIHSWRSSVGGCDKDGHWTRDPGVIAYYKRYYRGVRSKYLKRHCNHAVRNAEELYQRGAYKKVADFWWLYW